VSGAVEPESVGEALGAVNGIKALTEGIGPLFFGAMMTVSEHSAFPGWPYWIASLLVMIAYNLADQLPDNNLDHDEYIHELEFKQRSGPRDQSSNSCNSCLATSFATPTRDEEDEEYKGLLSLSEVDESEEDENRPQIEVTPLPQTFSSFRTNAPIGSSPFTTPTQTKEQDDGIEYLE
jgi:hypothetical protein